MATTDRTKLAEPGAEQGLRPFGYRPLETESNMVLALRPTWKTFEDYLKDMKSDYRSGIRKQLRDVAEAGLVLADLLAPVDLDLVIDIEVPTSQVLRRLASRRVCVDCGANYSLQARPLIGWTCDVCGGEVVQREDDTEEAISRRLEIYEEQTAPLIDWYRERGQLAQVAGTGTPETVTKRIVRAIEDRRNRKGGRFT